MLVEDTHIHDHAVLQISSPTICWFFDKKGKLFACSNDGWRHSEQAGLTCRFPCSPRADPCESVHGMRLVWKSLDKMRCLRKRSTIPFLGFLITFLLFLNLYIEDGYVLVSVVHVFSKHFANWEFWSNKINKALRWTGDLSRVYTIIAPMSAKIGSGRDPEKVSDNGWIDGWIDHLVFLYFFWSFIKCAFDTKCVLVFALSAHVVAVYNCLFFLRKHV